MDLILISPLNRVEISENEECANVSGRLHLDAVKRRPIKGSWKSSNHYQPPK